MQLADIRTDYSAGLFSLEIDFVHFHYMFCSWVCTAPHKIMKYKLLRATFKASRGKGLTFGNAVLGWSIPLRTGSICFLK